ncbi:hypothetical protein WR25_05208 [Diploscapter pachys]|uniref:LRRCT domain-containing protein n=1 Tax=Diploscapter pachys TaxID=2018661 RepID=A0A2A2JD78_9BILA|nr:hypothetical protein WR25_05208 [Diploscapter pachys]
MPSIANLARFFFLLLYSTKECLAQIPGSVGASWSQCLCIPVNGDSSLHILCSRLSSATVPLLPNEENSPRSPPPDIVAVSLSVISNLAFHRLRLIVLTLSNNRITEIEKMSLPRTLSFLDLRNNLLRQIPFLALKDVANLNSINLESNNISLLQSHPEVRFENEISLLLRNNKIKTLDGHSFRSFKRIKDLDISYNQIHLIEQDTFESISSLSSLDLSYNSIAYILHGTFKNFAKSLVRLNLEENVIHTLPDAFRDLRNLTYLNLNGNKLHNLDPEILQGFKKTLTELFIAYNHLKEIPYKAIGGMDNLLHLDLSKNRIQSLYNFSRGVFEGGYKSLMNLNLAGNQISSIDDSSVFEQMKNLVYLDLSYNNISHLEDRVFDKLMGLEKLFLQNNKLTKFPMAAVSGLHKLRHLILDNNLITQLPNYTLADLRYLEHLSLTGNQIKLITERMFDSSITRNLKTLNLANNKIVGISSKAFSDLNSLQQLILKNNQLKMIPADAFSNLINLRYLDLTGNQITAMLPLALNGLRSLDHLLLGLNRLESIDRDAIQGVSKLESLDISHNALHRFVCPYLGSIGSIVKLDVSHNEITQVDLSCLATSLEHLNLAHNDLQRISRGMLQQVELLRWVSLRHNGILEIQKESFENCPALAYIDLSHNFIKRVWDGTFIAQKQISRLDLSHNMIELIDAKSFGENNVLELNLGKNGLTKVPIDSLKSIEASIAVLRVDKNKIRIVESSQLSGLHNLSSLILSHNEIDSIEDGAFEFLSSLKILDLSHNPVSSWSPTAFRDLSHSINTVNLADTGLFFVPRLSHRNILNLNISWNKIYELTRRDMVPMTKLSSLDCSHNNMKTLDVEILEQLTDLKHLNLSGNPLTHVNPDHLRALYQLESLWISNMPSLVRLPPASSFSQLTNLKEFRMYDLPIETEPFIFGDILRNLPPLRSLYVQVRDNVLKNQLHKGDMRLLRELHITGSNLSQLTSITPFRYTAPPIVNQHGTILQTIRLEGNPILCDCELKWVAPYITVSNKESNDFQRVFCDQFGLRSPSIFNFYTQQPILCDNDIVNSVSQLSLPFSFSFIIVILSILFAHGLHVQIAIIG